MWTERHRRWLAAIRLASPAAQATLEDTIAALDTLCHRRVSPEGQITIMLPASPWALQAGRLRCLRGISTIIAVALARELAGFCWAITRIE